MNNHSIEELRRQYAAAESRLTNAKQAANAAKERLLAVLIEQAEAEFAARGIVKGSEVRIVSEPRVSAVGIYMGHRAASYGVFVVPAIHVLTSTGKMHSTQTYYMSSDTVVELAE